MYLLKDNLISNSIHINLSFYIVNQKSSSNYGYVFQIKNKLNSLNTLFILKKKNINVYTQPNVAIISLSSFSLFKS